MEYKYNIRFNFSLITFTVLSVVSLFLSGYAVGAIVMKENENEGNDDERIDKNHIDTHSPLSHHMHHNGVGFFIPSDIEVGKVMHIPYLGAHHSKSIHFLPREEANLIPFSLSKLPFLLSFFNFRRDSPLALAMKDSLTYCEAKPLQGERKFCATSLESMLDFVHEIFGPNTKVKALTSEQPASLNRSSGYNNSLIEEIRQVKAPKMVGCHVMPYPYAIFYCHIQEDSVPRVFRVSYRVGSNNNNNNDVMDAVVVCHMDTSLWSNKHESFRDYGIKHGSPVCHFMPEDNLAWVPSFETDDELEQVSKISPNVNLASI